MLGTFANRVDPEPLSALAKSRSKLRNFSPNASAHTAKEVEILVGSEQSIEKGWAFEAPIWGNGMSGGVHDPCPQIDVGEARRRIYAREDTTAIEVQKLLKGTREERRSAIAAVLHTDLRNSVDLLRELAELHDYADHDIMNLLRKLAIAADYPAPLIEVEKKIGIWFANEGHFETAMEYLHRAMSLVGERGLLDSRSLQTLKYLADPEIDAAIVSLARSIPHTLYLREDGYPRRITIFVAALIDENAPTTCAIRIAAALREAGYEVNFVSSEWVKSEGSDSLERLRADGFDVMFGSREGTYRERVDSILSFFERKPVDGTLFITTPVDIIAKLVSEIGTAPSQFFLNIGYEPACGKFDYIFQMVSNEQEAITAWPEKSKYVGNFVAIASLIDKATPIARQSVGVPEDALVLATFGRISKCSPDYLTAVGMILNAEPRAMLLLAGPAFTEGLRTLHFFLERLGIADRVLYLGQRQQDGPRLLKIVDVYLDPFPLPGGQSLLDAMYASVPVVGMRRHGLTEIDPTGVGATSSTVESFMPEGWRLAAAGDLKDYADIALDYLGNAEKRSQDGAALREHVLTHFANQFFDRINHYITQVINQKAHG